MSKSKVLIVFALLLLFVQIFAPNIGLLAESSKTSHDDASMLKVDVLGQSDEQIHWKVTVNDAQRDLEELKTTIKLGDGQSHGQIQNSGNAQVEKTGSGYVIETSDANSTYEFSVMTTIQNDHQSTFQLQAETTDGAKTYKAAAQVEVPTNSNVEEEASEESNVTTEEQSGETEPQTEDAGENKGEKSNGTEEDANTAEEEEASNYESVLAQLKSKPLEDFTEDELRKLIAGLTEEEIEKLKEQFEVTEEIGVVDPNFKPFAKNRQSMFRTMSNNPEWPNAGSVKLNGKDATPTDTYGEWEIELSVEAKDINTTKRTDIVLVLDKSGSMQGTRLAKAKAAAIQFINELLTEGSQTRIAAVTFSNDYQTLAGGFKDSNSKQSLINAINGISASGGTNIQGGIRTANNLLATQSTAEEKIIVLLSDGEPTYSYKANAATAHTWPFGNYNFRLTSYPNNPTQIGSGADYDLRDSYICGWVIPLILPRYCDERYEVNGHYVTTNGPATISEAWQTMTNGINMYTIGLDVGNNTNATNVLRNSQNKGYYQAGVDDLSGIFGDIAGEIKAAATNAVVTDPLGDMFKLVRGAYSGNDFSLNKGNVNYDEASKTITWNIGTINEDDHPTLKYTVTIDWEHPDLKGHVDYPMNKETPLNYTDFNGNPATKYFEIPKGQIGKGKIKRIGYRVNADGDPIDSNGNVVSREQAETFYDEYFEDLHDYGTHEVPAKDVDDYTLIVGDDPTSVTIDPDHPVKTVYFGYAKTSELPAGNVIAKYWDEDGNTLVPDMVHTGNLGDDYETEKLDIPGYAFDKMHEDSADPTGKFTTDEQTVIYVYKQLKGTIKILKADEEDENEKLPGAKFNVIDSTEVVVAELITDENGEATTDPLPIGEYTIVEVEAPTGYELVPTDMQVTVEANKETTKTIKNKKKLGSLTVYKKDADGDNPLKGATFELRDADDNIVGTSQTTENDGVIEFTDLAWGTYKLVETKAPEGYNLLAEPITIEITKDNLDIEKTVENSLIGWDIPKTGGIGTIGFYISGMFLMVSAAWFVIRRRLA